MTGERLKKMLLISTMARNGVLFVISLVALGCTLYVILAPTDDRSAARHTGGGIPVIDLAASAAPQFDYDYWTDSGAKPAWMPKRIKTDGRKTYIQFPDADLLEPPQQPGEVSRAPSLVVMKAAQGEVSTYRYSVVGDSYEVMGVIEKAVLIGPSGDENDRVLILHGPVPSTDPK